jgi:hypothetical protein
VAAEPREVHIHPEDAREERQREQDDAHHRQDLQAVLLAVRDERLVRRLEPLDDFLVVVEQVPDPFGGVDDVVEVELEILRQEALGVPLEDTERRALRLDDLAVRDDLLLRVRDVADDLVARSLEDLGLDRVELRPDLVEDREAVVEEVVEDVVEEISGPFREQLLA